jgi:hypothetical protein
LIAEAGAPTRPVALSDGQLRMVMVAARPLEPQKRCVLLQRICMARHSPMAMSRRRSDLALVGLIHEPAA